MRRFAWIILGASLAFFPGAGPAGAAAEHYRVVDRYRPGGEGGWDYVTVDPAAHRLYVSRSTRVQVIDLNTGKLVGEVADTPGVHGIALAPEFGRGYISCGRDTSVTIFDLATLAPITKVKVGGRTPDAILYDRFSKRVFAFNHTGRSFTAIDARSATVAGTVDLDGTPEFAVSDEQGSVFVNLEDSSKVVRFDPKTLKVLARWPLNPGEEPTGLALDREHHRLFAGCGNQKMIVLDAGNGHVIADLPIGSGVDATGFDAARNLAFSSNGQGSLTVVQEEAGKFTVVESDSTQRGARTMALDPGTHRLYLPTASFGEAPAATPENPRPRRPMIPDSFVILVMER
jgi:DNA-binding beta-propeller fold protein YncE